MKASVRILRLLSLLQSKREWSGEELSARLEVNVRTLRRDVDRLRALGYVIDASSGPGGGYRLGAGSSTPPLLLDDDEAIAIAMSLGAAAGTVAKLQDVSLRVLAKLDQIMPRRLRRKLSSLPEVTLSLIDPRIAVDLDVLSSLASACRDHVEVRFAYRDGRGQRSIRTVEPMRLVHTGRVWYLAAWDIDRGEWRTFRVDRIDTGSKIARREPFVPRRPPEDLATYVSRSISASPYRYQARLRMRGSKEQVSKSIPAWVGVVEPLDEEGCTLTIGGNSYEAIAAYIVYVNIEFELLDPPEMAKPLREIAARLQRGAKVNRTVA